MKPINTKKIFKRLFITLLTIVILLVTLVYSLRIPAVQNFIKDQFVTYLEDKIKTDVELEYIYIDFPSTIELKQLYLKGEDIDTLLAVEKLNVGLDLWKILNRKVEINAIDLKGATANITLRKDGTYNFDYILNAFASKEEDTSESKPFLINLDKIKLEKIAVQYNDLQAGNHIKVKLNSFNTRIKTFDLDKNKYALGKINLDGFKLKLKQDFVEYVATKTKETTSSTPLQLKLDEINLANFDVVYEDEVNKLNADLKFKTLNTFVKFIDLEKNSYGLDTILTDGLRVNIKQGLNQNATKEEEIATTTSTPLQFALNQIKLIDTKINYADDNSKIFAEVQVNELNTKINKLDLENNYYNLDEFTLSKSNIKANIELNENSESEQKNTNKPVTLILKQGKLNDFNLVYNNTKVKPIKYGLDYNHINIKPLDLDLRNFKMFENQFSGTIKSATLKEKSGLTIKAFTTDFLYANQQAYLKNLYLRTPQTILQKEIKLGYTSINQFSDDLGKVKIYADIKNSKIGFKDLLILAPQLKQTSPFNQYPNATIYANANLYGVIDDFKIDQFSISGIDDINIKAHGNIKNATNPNNLKYNLALDHLNISAKAIYTFLPKNTIPNTIRIPSKINVRGYLKGTTSLIDTNLKLSTTLGNATINGLIDLQTKEKYTINATINNVETGTILSNNELGKLTATLKIDGVGFNPKTAKIKAEAIIKEVNYTDYNLQNIQLNAQLNNGNFDANILSNDQKANLNLTISGNYKDDEFKALKIDGTINQLNLQQLKLYDKPLIIAGDVNGELENFNIDQLNGNLQLSNFAISDTKEIYELQNISLTANSTENHNLIRFDSQFATINIEGNYKLSQIANAISQTINQYYSFKPEGLNVKISPHQEISLEATIKNDELIRKFVPELTDFEPINLNATYHTDSQNIEVFSEIPSIVYKDITIKNAKLNAANPNETLNFNLDVATLKNESYQLDHLNLNGDIANNLINFTAKKDDDLAKTQFLIAGNIINNNNSISLHLNPNGFILNYEPWKVKEDNSIQINNTIITANDFEIAHNDSKIKIHSDNNDSEEILNINIDNFKIETITEIIKTNDLPAEGTINGSAKIYNLSKAMSFTTDLTISDLKVFTHPIGNIIAKIENNSADILDVDIELNGTNNNAKLKGNYNINQSIFDLDLALNRLDMMTIEQFSNHKFKQAEGYISGNLNLNGTTEQPVILGNLKLNDAGLTITETGSTFKNINDPILFTKNGIKFNQFKINDKDNNALTINGTIFTQNYTDFDFDLTAIARNFKIVNSEKSSDAITYGKLAVNANLQIKGDLNLPKVSGNLSVTDQTDFTFILPQSSPELQEREGIVEFIDKNQIDLEKTITINDLNTNTKITGLDVNVNIDVNKKAKTTIVIDKANGDYLELQGEAQLTGGIDPSGKTTLVGVYEAESGAYELSVSLIKKRFDIKKGSTITWTGEPTTAMLNITAVYTANASPIDLVQQQLTGLSANEINMYKQKIPFNTNLILTGELLNPKINFNITLNDDNPSVPTSVIDNTKSKLEQLKTDESELNKQVFALILLGRFIGENPFQSQSGVSAQTLAKQSVSNILAQQLNNVAADLIKGVDINFGLNTDDDYSTGSKNTRTDLNVAVSKKLLNDRLKIVVGSNFGLEGEARENENMNNIAGDITIDYNLSRNGRYVLRAFRKNEYQVALHGQVIETGIGFIITVDYDKFKELFQKNKQGNQSKKSKKTESK